MKAQSGWFGNFFMTLLVFFAGVALIYGSQWNPEVGQKIGELLKNAWLSTFLGSFLLMSVFLRWIFMLNKPKDAYINFESDDGNVGISTKAICDFTERIGKEFSSIKSMKAKLQNTKKGVVISLSVKVLAGNKIPELSHVLQQRVRSSVRESLGLEEISDIIIKVQEIVGDPKGSSPAPVIDVEPPVE